MGEASDARLARIEDRLRQVLNLISEAPIDCTTIPGDAGGDFQGNDWFIGTRLRDEADALLSQWDREDEKREVAAPPPGGDGAGPGTGEHGS